MVPGEVSGISTGRGSSKSAVPNEVSLVFQDILKKWVSRRGFLVMLKYPQKVWFPTRFLGDCKISLNSVVPDGVS